MNPQVKMLRDISMVYELSLSIGTALDLNENCSGFLKVLNLQKELAFSSIWIKRDDVFELVEGMPQFRVNQKSIKESHFIIEKLSKTPFFSFSSKDKDFKKMVLENDISEGTFGVFKLGEIGFLKIFNLKRTEAYELQEMTQLVAVMEKLRISLEGSIAHRKYSEEIEARLNTQDQLLKTNLRYKDLFENMYDALIILDEKSRLKSINNAGRKILGMTTEKVSEIILGELIHPDDLEHSREYIRQLHKKGFYSGYEGRIMTLDGKTKWIQVNSNVIKRGGKIVGSRDIVRDITNQKEAEEKIQKNEARLRQLIDTALDAIISIDARGIVTEWNKPAESMFEFTRTEAIGTSLHNLIIPEKYRKAHQEGMKKFFKTGHGPVLNNRIEITGVKKSGVEFPIELSITDVEDGGTVKFNSFVRDLTEQKKAEKELLIAQNTIKKSEEKYRGIIENMELGLLEVDTNQTIVRVYDKFCELTGYTEKELLGKNAEKVFLPKEYIPVMAQQELDRSNGNAGVYEIQIFNKKGERIWVLISGAPIINSEGEATGSLGIHYDLTARKKLEEDLSKAKQEAELARLAEQQFLANMSHEIRTPMNAVIGMTNLLYKTNPSNEQKEFLDILGFSADNLMGLIDNILDISKIESGKLEFENREVHLQQLLYSLHLTFQFKVKDKPISIVMDFDSDIENYVMADPTRLNQILYNLMGNASKFTERGTIGVKAELEKEEGKNYWIRFTVYDTGIGIKKEQLKYIFENFKQADIQTTRKYGGTGLGLTIVKELVEMQGGSISVDSNLGQGSTFKVILPMENTGRIADPEEVSTKSRDWNETEVLKELDVLVVEDNLMNQKFINKILEIWGSDKDLAVNGLEAVKMSEKKKYDLILMDIHMPEMDGVDATLNIRGNAKNPNQETPIIALTAAALLQEKNRALSAGMNSFLTKPFSPAMLKDRIFDCLEIKEPLEPALVETKTKKAKKEKTKPKTRLVDLTYLNDFSGGDQHFIRDMLQTYVSDAPKAIDDLNTAHTEGDWDQVYKIAHRMKPNFSMLGMKEQETTAKSIELMVKEDRLVPKEMKSMILSLTEKARKSFPEVEEELKGL